MKKKDIKKYFALFFKKNNVGRKKIEIINKFNENSIIYKTMRMSINEIKVTDE